MSKHASVRIAGYEVPLIGVPVSATNDRCDGCGKDFHIQELAWVMVRTGNVLVCYTCQQNPGACAGTNTGNRRP